MNRAILRAYATGWPCGGSSTSPRRCCARSPARRHTSRGSSSPRRGSWPGWRRSRSGSPRPARSRRWTSSAVADAESRFLAVRPPRPVFTEDREADGIPVRLYPPEGATEDGPLLVFFHGGGWVQRSIQSHDASVRLLAHLSGIRVVSVEYRRAPEHPYPAAVDDALTACTHIATTFGATKIAVGGYSAGGNLAAAVALTADPTPAFQWLLYPARDAVNRHPSAKDFATGFYLTEAAMDRYTDLYLPDPGRRGEPRASPLLTDDVSHMPAAYVAIAAADPLRDEGEAYARRLRERGRPGGHAALQPAARLLQCHRDALGPRGGRRDRGWAARGA